MFLNYSSVSPLSCPVHPIPLSCEPALEGETCQPELCSHGSITKTCGSSTSAQLTNQDRGIRLGAAAGVRSTLPIIKVPAPEVYGHYPSMDPEPLASKKTGLQR